MEEMPDSFKTDPVMYFIDTNLVNHLIGFSIQSSFL